jgi:hypothetical protein
MKNSVAPVCAMLLVGGLLLSGHQVGHASASTPACEPGAELDLAVRVVEVAQEADQARVTLEVVLSSQQALRSYRILETRSRSLARDRTRTGSSRAGEDRTREVAQRDLTEGRSSLQSAPPGRSFNGTGGQQVEVGGQLSGRPEYVMYHSVVLDLGKEHGLKFSAFTENSAGGQAAASAYVQVNLDPDQQPELVDGLVQFRAQVAP